MVQISSVIMLILVIQVSNITNTMVQYSSVIILILVIQVSYITSTILQYSSVIILLLVIQVSNITSTITIPGFEAELLNLVPINDARFVLGHLLPHSGPTWNPTSLGSCRF